MVERFWEAAVVVCLFLHGVFSQECYNQPNCTGDSVAVLVSTAKECCVGTNDGMSFADANGTCTILQCIVHGFANASYDVNEGEMLEIIFQLNVKATTTLPNPMLSGNITSAIGPNTSITDFKAFPATTVTGNRTDNYQLFTTDDDITLEYDDTVLLTFSPFNDIIQAFESAGEFLRDTATVNIIDNDLLQINFEEPGYSLREGGDPQLPPIQLMFRRTQSPFTMTLFPVSITEAIDPAGFNRSDFIPSEDIDDAMPGDDFTNVPFSITIPATEEGSNGIFIIPEMFNVIDDDIDESVKRFALVAQLGRDVPDRFACFQRHIGDTECFGRSGATEITFFDDDDMIIGFSQRARTVLENDTKIRLDVHSLRLSELDYEVLISIRPYTTSRFDGIQLDNSTDPLRESYMLYSGDQVINGIEIIVHDDPFPETDECYTIEIWMGVSELCYEDYSHPTDYFCKHTICIEDNDEPFEVGYVQTTYTVNESEGAVEVCVNLTKPQEDIGDKVVIVRAYDFRLSKYIPSGVAFAEPDYFNPFTGMYRMDPSSDYEAQVYFFNRIRYTFIHANRRIVCYNQTIYDDMRLEVSEYFGLKLYVEEYYTTFPTEVQPMYDEVAIQILDNDMAVVGLERTLYTMLEDVGMFEVCAIVYSPTIDCPIEFPFNVSLSTRDGTAVSPMDYKHEFSTILSFPACETRQCVDVVIVNDLRDEPEEGFSVTLERTPDLDSRIMLHPLNGEIFIEDDDVFVRFYPTSYTTTESQGSVTVWVHVDEGVSQPFTVALLPGEGFEKSSHYILECNVRLDFNSSIRSLSYTYNITPDDSCDFQFGGKRQERVELFKVDLTLTNSTDPLVAIDFDRAEATVFIDDSMEEECMTVVGYEQSVYTLFEEDGYLEVCVVVTKNGSLTPFVININTTNGTAESTKFTQTVKYLTFFNDSSNMSGKKCYNLTVISDSDMYCEYYRNCTSAYLVSQLTTDDFVRIENSRVHIFIEENFTLCENINTECTTSNPEQSTSTPHPGQTFSTTAVVVISAVVIVMLASIAVMSVIVLYLYFKKNKVKASDITLDQSVHTKLGNQYSIAKTKESRLLQQLRTELKGKRMIVSKDQIHLTSTVGHGESGLVYKGYINTPLGSELVAVKTGKALFSSGDLEQLTKEISTMLSFEHPNVMSLVGVCLDGEMPLLIMPFMSNGSVLEYVRHHKQELLLTSEAKDEEVLSAKKTFLMMCHQITKGMTYLAKERFVHRDLAARNCMIDGCGVIKVADFGLTEDMYGTNYFRRRKSETGSEEKVPIRWMAPESIESDIYDENTDVWSFGVTVWELFTCGSVPYSGISAMSVLRTLKAGQRLEKPENAACSNEIYSLMTSCWNLDPHQRPKFANLQCDASDLLEAVAGYIQLSSSLNWKGKEPEDKSTTYFVPMEMIDEVEESAADLCLASAQETPM